MISLKTGLALAGAAGILIAAGLHLAADARTAGERDRLRQEASDWKAAATGWKAAHDIQRDRRAGETRAAATAISEAGKACDARVDRARASARTIREIIHAPVPTNADGCPVPGLVDPGLVQRALRPGR